MTVTGDLYQRLGVSPDATMNELDEAGQILSRPSARADYDRRRVTVETRRPPEHRPALCDDRLAGRLRRLFVTTAAFVAVESTWRRPSPSHDVDDPGEDPPPPPADVPSWPRAVTVRWRHDQ